MAARLLHVERYPGAYSKGQPERERLFKDLSEPLPDGFLAVCLLDCANAAQQEGAEFQHPFDSSSGKKLLERWLTNCDSEHFSFAVSAAVALPSISAPERDALLALAFEHPSAYVQLEAAWAAWKMGRDAGIKWLARSCLDINLADRAKRYLTELGHEDAIPADAEDPTFQAKATFAQWLAHPNELGRPPDNLEIYDHRELQGPPDRETKEMWLLKYLIKDETGLKPDNIGVGLVGSVTFCLFTYQLEQRPPEDGYAIHCYSEMACRLVICQTQGIAHSHRTPQGDFIMRCHIAWLFFLLCLMMPKQVDSNGPESAMPPGPWQHPPERDKPEGKIVTVRTEPELQNAVRALKSGTTILIAPGTYELTNTLKIGGRVKNVALCGDTRDHGKVVLKGKGMRTKEFGNVPHGILVSDATDVLLADLSVGDVWYHPITLQGQEGCKRVRLFNVRLFDAGQQFLKANPDGKGGGADDCMVEYCVFEYTDSARGNYTQGMSVHACANWVVRNNLFRNLRGPKGDSKVGGCIDFWDGSKNATVEGNLMINCRIGIRFGIVNRAAEKGIHDNEGGVVRNNVFWRQRGAVEEADAGIIVADSPGTKVLHNTVILNGTYSGGAIEFRWCKDVTLANNLTDGNIRKREEAEGNEENNVVTANAKLFVDAAAGNLHLSAQGASSLIKVKKLADCPDEWEGKKRGDKTDPGADEYRKAG